MTASSRRVFLHVGCPKTGTTYLQSTFWRSRDALSAQGLHLPLRGQPDHFFLSLAVRESLDPASEGPEAFDVLDRLAAELGATFGAHDAHHARDALSGQQGAGRSAPRPVR